MPNPKGHPESLVEHKFTTTRKEPCTAQLNLRVPPSLSAKIKERENWQEFVRQTLLEKLEAESA